MPRIGVSRASIWKAEDNQHRVTNVLDDDDQIWDQALGHIYDCSAWLIAKTVGFELGILTAWNSTRLRSLDLIASRSCRSSGERLS